MLDLLAFIRPAQVLQAGIGRVVVFVVDGVLVVPLGEAEGDRNEHVDVVGFAVDHDANVAAFLGFGGGDHAKGGFEASEGGDLCVSCEAMRRALTGGCATRVCLVGVDVGSGRKECGYLGLFCVSFRIGGCIQWTFDGRLFHILVLQTSQCFKWVDRGRSPVDIFKRELST